MKMQRAESRDTETLHVLDDDAISKQTADELQAMGYTLVWSKPERIYGAVNALVRTATGWSGAADPRGGGAALGD